MPTCALCNNKITSANDSKEHIIPQSIGGRKKVRGFICNSCNNTCGSSWDAELANQYNWFSVMLNIKRESGKPPPSHRVQTIKGQDILLHANGSKSLYRQVVTKSKTTTGIQFQVQARTMAEARNTLMSIQRKYPKANIDDVLANLIIDNHPVEAINTSFQFGGNLAGRSYVKTAIAMASKMGIAPQTCDIALHYLKHEDATPAYAEFHIRDLVTNRPSNKLVNSVTVSGNPTTNLLTAYIEYFGVTRVVVHLSQSYKGSAVHETYAFDPITGQPFHLEVNLELSNEEYALSLENKALQDGALEKAFEYAMPIIQQFEYERENKNGMNAAIAEAFEAMGVKYGEELPPEKIPAFSIYLTNELTSHFMQRIERRPKPENEK